MNDAMGVEGVLDHLMFHKAMIDEDDRAEKIDRYLSILEPKAMQHIFDGPIGPFTIECS